jgi:hypothetical protein
MMVLVFIWLPKRRNTASGSETDIGHGAMIVKNQYVSNWPGTAWSIVYGPGQANSFEDDVAAEGGQAQLIYRIDGLNEDAMVAKWKDMKTDLKYSFPTYNCFTTVAEVLSAGMSWLQSVAGDTVVPHQAVIAHVLLI